MSAQLWLRPLDISAICRVSFLYQFLIDHLSPVFPFLCSHMWQVLLFIIIGWAERSVPRFKFSSAPSSFLLSGHFHRHENHLPHLLLILHSRNLHCSYSSSAIHHPEFSYQKKILLENFPGILCFGSENLFSCLISKSERNMRQKCALKPFPKEKKNLSCSLCEICMVKLITLKSLVHEFKNNFYRDWKDAVVAKNTCFCKDLGLLSSTHVSPHTCMQAKYTYT